MTIRDHFQRVFKRITYCAVGAAIVVVCVLTWRYPHLTRLQNAGIGLLLGPSVGDFFVPGAGRI